MTPSHLSLRHQLWPTVVCSESGEGGRGGALVAASCFVRCRDFKEAGRDGGVDSAFACAPYYPEVAVLA